MSEWEDYARRHPCVGSGMCCKKGPCDYGEADPATGACVHLVPWQGDDLPVERYRCGRYEFIRTRPGAEWMPAFGAGCCMPLFNQAREAILVELRKKPRAGSREPVAGESARLRDG